MEQTAEGQASTVRFIDTGKHRTIIHGEPAEIGMSGVQFDIDSREADLPPGVKIEGAWLEVDDLPSEREVDGDRDASQ